MAPEQIENGSQMVPVMEKPPNMAPAWLPKRSQNGLKTNAKINQKFDNFRDRFLKDFSGSLAPKWSQNGSKTGLKIGTADDIKKPTKH